MTAITPEAAHAEFLARRHFSSLDGLRAISIIGVVWHHVGNPGHVWHFFERGAEGVTLFFAISGFLITTLLLREKARFGSISLKMFFARRTLRIFPLYFAVLAVFIAVGFYAGRHSFFGERFFPYLPYYLTYTSNWAPSRSTPFGHSWSLACEEQFYLLWPTILVLLGTRRATWSLIGLIVANQVAELTANPVFFDNPFPVKLLMTFQPSIALGVLLAVALDSRRGFAILAPALGNRYAAPVAFLLMMGLLSLPGDIHRFMLVDITMALVVGACVVPQRHEMTRFLNIWPFLRIGAVSYGIYLMHMPLITAIYRVVPLAPPVLFVVALLVTWAVAELSFATFERYFQGLKGRFERRE